MFSLIFPAGFTLLKLRSIGMFTLRAAIVEVVSVHHGSYGCHFMADTIPLDYMDEQNVEPVEYVANF